MWISMQRRHEKCVKSINTASAVVWIGLTFQSVSAQIKGHSWLERHSVGIYSSFLRSIQIIITYYLDTNFKLKYIGKLEYILDTNLKALLFILVSALSDSHKFTLWRLANPQAMQLQQKIVEFNFYQ